MPPPSPRRGDSIVLGEADVAICGGVETGIEAVPVAAFTQLGMLSTNNDDPPGACRPFDKDRDGMVFGEGGALMLIETEQHAKARGARILARLMGAGITSDSYDVVKPDPSGERAGDAIARAIELAGLTPADIDHINAHATGTISVTWPKPAPSEMLSVATRRRCMRPRRRWVIRWAPPERWRPC